jgi:DNA-binding CsgD family transcriptional regulator
MAGTQFVGRRGELDRLGRVLLGDPEAASAAVVTGDAGIGKTRLLAEVLGTAPDVLILAGACLPLSESLPYGAVTDGLSALAGRSGRPTLDRALSRCAAYVGPQVAALIPTLSEDPRGAVGAVDDRSRLFAAVQDLLAALGAERRTVLIVEDLHWADSGTLDLLTFLVRGHLPSGSALVVTSRRDELTSDDPTRDWLAATVRVPGVESVALASLSDADVGVMIASLVDSEPPASFVANMLRRGEGNPFFTEQLVAAARDGAPPFAGPTGVPAGVEQMLLSRVRSVGVAATQVASALAVAARPLAEAELNTCVGTDVDVELGLRELLDAHLVEPASEDRYRLRHALLEDTMRATLLASQQATLHAGVAGALAARAGEAPAEVAAHWSRAGNRVEEARWSVAAAQRAEAVYAWREASASWQRVWELWAILPSGDRPPVELPAVARRCVLAAFRADDMATALRLVRAALADKRVTADDATTADLLSRYGNRVVSTDVVAGLAAHERAVALFEQVGYPSVEQAQALARFVLTKQLHGATTGSEDAELARATAIADALEDLDLQVELAATRLGTQLETRDEVEEDVAELATALQRAVGAGAESGELWAALVLTDAYIWLLRLGEGVQAGMHFTRRAFDHGFGESYRFALLVANTVECLLLRGDLAAAHDMVLAHLLPDVTNAGWPLHWARAELSVLGGDLADALSEVGRIDELGYQQHDMVLCLAEVAAVAELWRGQPWRARDRIDDTWTFIKNSPLASRAGRMLTLGAQAAADLADTTPGADRDQMAKELQRKAVEAECYGRPRANVLGTAYGATFEAELARLTGIGGPPAWRAAKEAWAGHGVPHHAAYAGWRLAECLLDAGQRKEAGTELAAAYTAGEGHTPLRREIGALARRARLTLPVTAPGSPQPAEADGTGDARRGLTARELDVLRLLGTGATNAEIGRRLYMSPKTASVHVTAILRKLQVSGRVQAATVAERMGLLAADTERSRDP